MSDAPTSLCEEIAMKAFGLLVVSVSLLAMFGCASPETAVITSVTAASPCQTATLCTRYYHTDVAGQVWFSGWEGSPGLVLKPGTKVHLNGGRITGFEWRK